MKHGLTPTPPRKGEGSRAGIIERARLSASLLLFFSLAALSPAAAEPPHHPGGFWKCKTNNAVPSPEFGGEDPVGLASGKHIPADCAIHWSDGHGKTFCFSSLPSLNFFDSELGLREKAEEFWAKERGAVRR